MNIEDVEKIKEKIKRENSRFINSEDYDKYIIRDIVEQLLLKEIYSIEEFKERFAFKGGTALSKCFLNYHRFSVDLDLTYALAYKEIEKAYSSTNQKKKAYDEMRRFVGHTLQIVADNLKDSGIRFIYNPSDKNWVHIKYNKKIVTYNFELLYPELKDNKLKVEMNFTERLYYEPVRVLAKTYGNLSFSNYTPVEVLAYNPKEMLVEKYKAMLSRVVWRDYFDAYFLYKKLGMLPRQVEDVIVDKFVPLFSLERIKNRTLYTINRYATKEIQPEIIREQIYEFGDLIIHDLPPDFDRFVIKTINQLTEIGKKIVNIVKEKELEEENEKMELGG